jgi:hypothetical protein
MNGSSGLDRDGNYDRDAVEGRLAGVVLIPESCFFLGTALEVWVRRSGAALRSQSSEKPGAAAGAGVTAGAY